MLPAICLHARICFRRLDPEAREEAVQEVLCNAMRAYVRLVELGKVDVAYPTVLARYGVAQVRDGRKVGAKLNIRDVMSPYCQRQKGVVVERLDLYDAEEDAWREILVEDRHAGPADVAATRMDFDGWLQSLPKRLRKIATVLATSETTSATARRFGVSDGRVSQIRRELYNAWRRFVGEAPDADDAASATA
jgi:DNA-directed RNA polymerase specialized sigma24 family protein